MTLTLISIVFLIALSAFFSGSETGLTGVSRAKIHKLKAEGHKRATLVSKLHDKNDDLISTILLGNNAVNILASALATSLAVREFGDEGVFYVTVILTMVVLVFAEVMPKTFAFRNAEKVALTVAPIFSVLITVFYPITWVVRAMVAGILKIFGKQMSGDGGEVDMQDTDALRGSIEMHHDAGAVVKDDRNMLGSILDLAIRDVSEVMLHRKVMFTCDADLPQEEMIQKLLTSSYTRIPFWKDDSDNIIGVLHVRDAMQSMQQNGQDSFDLLPLLKEPWFVPQTTSLADQLKAFRKKQTHFAFVVDEYGAILGLVTLEDILEEIVGQIEDEYDQKELNIVEHRDGSHTIRGTVTIRDINRDLDWDLPADGASTLAGLIMHEAKVIPNVKQVFHFHGYRFEILRKQRNQILQVRVRKL